MFRAISTPEASTVPVQESEIEKLDGNDEMDSDVRRGWFYVGTPS